MKFNDYEYYICAKTRELLVTWDNEMFFEMRTAHMSYRRPSRRYTGFVTADMEARSARIFRGMGLYNR